MAALAVLLAVGFFLVKRAQRKKQAKEDKMFMAAKSDNAESLQESKGSSLPSGSLPKALSGSREGTLLSTRSISRRISGPLEDLFSWEIAPESITILQRPDGEDFLLGKGAFGQVLKVHWCTS